ncbi:putative polyketide synthase protein [Venturia nashicola]|uniref:Putative polyketide synthase protein n=1 Tax=Venturia nashicola TaxID=86259 RepID=A0A4Z1NKH4_9PEZI|nr:putative polyketide synthase protein [Venturia nashicola]TLD23609.1 putative polyketide synthase protein [Venturia nashicola]
MTTNSAITTPVPASVTSEALIAALHDHQLYFKIVDTELIEAKLVSGDPTKLGDKCTYAVKSKQHTSDYTLTNLSDGVDAEASIKSPVGALVVKMKWRVSEGKLNEDIEIEANFVMRKMSKGPTEKNSKEAHLRFIEEVSKV